MTNPDIKFQWHELDPGFGGYASVEIGKGHHFQVLTTPISTQSQQDHFIILHQKIEHAIRKSTENS